MTNRPCHLFYRPQFVIATFFLVIISLTDAFARPLSLIGSRSFGCVSSPAVGGYLRLPHIYSSTTQLNAKGGIELAGLLYDSTSTAFDAWEWYVGQSVKL